MSAALSRRPPLARSALLGGQGSSRAQTQHLTSPHPPPPPTHGGQAGKSGMISEGRETGPASRPGMGWICQAPGEALEREKMGGLGHKGD